MKSYVIKHEPSGKFVAISDEIGPFSVPLDEAQLFSLDVVKEFVDPESGMEYLDDEEISIEDLSIYEVEVILGNKI